MKLLPLVFVLCFSSIATSQVIDENYATDLTNTRGEEENAVAQRKFDLLVARLESIKGSDSNKDLFVLGVTNGKQARFYAVPGTHKTAEKILQVSQRNYRWRLYGRSTDQLGARQIMSSAKREYVASTRPKFA